MSPTTYDLIGQIINPRPKASAAAGPRRASIPTEPVNVLIGRILSPPGAVIRMEPISPTVAAEAAVPVSIPAPAV